MKSETVIGLEIHAELSTETKAFCSCRTEFGKEANTQCCPVCLGMPGALPVLNKKVVEYAVKMGLATNCSISKKSLNARKNYFYPDLPKGYQISQAENPICTNGYLMVNNRKIRINRIHIEEDAGKLVHKDNETLIDYNRAGVPLLEIVTEPDLRSAEEAKLFMEKIRDILLCLEISDCRMQEGSLRSDVNVSVRDEGKGEYNERCEMKNINSFSAVLRCIKYEEARQQKLLREGITLLRETRRWDDEKGESYVMRNKENAADYRYFTEPDLNCVVLTEEYIEKVRQSMPELPDEKRARYVKEFGLLEKEADEIVNEKAFTRLLEDAVNFGANAKSVYNRIVSDISRILNERGLEADKMTLSGQKLAELIRLTEENVISVTVSKSVLEEMFDSNKAPIDIVKEKGFTQINDRNEIYEIVKAVVIDNEKSVADYKSGKKNAFGFLVGQCMKKTDSRANPTLVREALEEILSV